MAKSYGYQPKMCRLRVLHTFLWHVIYGHPLLNTPPDAECAAETTQLNESDLDGSNLKPEDNTETSGASSLYETLGEEEEELTNDQLNPESVMKGVGTVFLDCMSIVLAKQFCWWTDNLHYTPFKYFLCPW